MNRALAPIVPPPILRFAVAAAKFFQVEKCFGFDSGKDGQAPFFPSLKPRVVDSSGCETHCAPETGIKSCAPLLKVAVQAGIFDSMDEASAPVAQFYDLDLWDTHLQNLRTSFGPTFRHMMAVKSCPLSRLLKYAHESWGLGVEAASIGELKLAMEHCGFPSSDIVFDSPAKTRKELEFSLEHGIYTNLDNFVEYERAKEIIKQRNLDVNPHALSQLGPIGLRVNPLVGAGKIAALSVSTSDSKFGVLISDKESILAAYADSPWMTSLHVHVGSGGMGLLVLAAGVRALVDLAKFINTSLGRQQIVFLDIGGGLPVNYKGDTLAAEKVPTFSQYAAHLREHVPELFSGEFEVRTEFGQSIFAKVGFLASRIEWMKSVGGSGAGDSQRLAVVHFGADLCVRQIYTTEHERRVEAYGNDGSEFGHNVNRGVCQVAGPLCFQGDFVTKNANLPDELKEGDIIVLKDAGSNTLSMHNRHCSRLAPPVYGFRWKSSTEVDEFSLVEIKARETFQELYGFWGAI